MSKNLLINAQIHTLDDAHPTATALAIDAGRIVAIGETSQLQAKFGDSYKSEDLHGQVILPGLTDAHLHLQLYVQGLEMVDCETATREECLRRLSERVRQTPPGEWVRGTNWNHNAWEETHVSADELDAIAPHNPIYITHKSYHSAWVNHHALELARLNAETPDPPGSRLGRLPDGSPDGVLYEGSAMMLVEGIIPAPTPQQLQRMFHDAQPGLWQVGLTGVHDFDRRDCFSALQMLHTDGELKLRVLKSIPLENLHAAVELGLRSGFGDDMLRIGSVKAFMDGALGPQTAAMLAPYEGSQNDRGILILDSEELFEHARLAARNGLSMAVHAIGDRAVREVLNAYQWLREYERANPATTKLRHRIEHVQLIHPNDVHRLAELEIIASMQPLHATSDMLMADRFWGERSRLAYAPRAQLQAGARVAFGSDAPIEAPNPFLGLHAAVTRRRADGSPGVDGWYPEQRLSLSEALHGFTRGPAYAAGMEDRLGRLAPGFLADLIVLERDPFKIDPHELQHLRPVRTMVGGKWVYRKN